VIIGADRTVWFGEIDDTEREIIRGEPREIFQRRFRDARELRAQVGVHRNGFEFAEVSESGDRKKDKDRDDEAAHVGQFSMPARS